MLIQFSDASDLGGDTANDALADMVHDAVQLADPALWADVKWERGNEVRFTLPGATTAQHEAVILALLTRDPRATIRTSRARYAGLDDYQRQKVIHSPA